MCVRFYMHNYGISHHSPAFQRQAGQSHDSFLIINCESGHLDGDLIACARYRVSDERAKLSRMNRELGSTHVLFVIHLPRQSTSSTFIGFQGEPWISTHIDELRPQARNSFVSICAMQRKISELFLGRSLYLSIKRKLEGSEHFNSKEKGTVAFASSFEEKDILSKQDSEEAAKRHDSDEEISSSTEMKSQESEDEEMSSSLEDKEDKTTSLTDDNMQVDSSPKIGAAENLSVSMVELSFQEEKDEDEEEVEDKEEEEEETKEEQREEKDKEQEKEEEKEEGEEEEREEGEEEEDEKQGEEVEEGGKKESIMEHTLKRDEDALWPDDVPPQYMRLHECIQAAVCHHQSISNVKERATELVGILVDLIPRNPKELGHLCYHHLYFKR